VPADAWLTGGDARVVVDDGRGQTSGV